MGLESFPPLVVTGIRLALGAGVLACVPAARRGRVARSDWPRVLLLGVLWMALPLTLFPIAQQTVDSGVAGMLTGAQPLLTALVAAILLRRRPRGAHVVGLVIGFVGILTIAGTSLTTGGGSSLAGVAMILVAVACYALAVNLAVPLQQRYGTLPVVLRALAVATALVAPLAMVAASGVDKSAILPTAWVAVALLGIVCTGLAYAMLPHSSDGRGRLAARLRSTSFPWWRSCWARPSGVNRSSRSPQPARLSC